LNVNYKGEHIYKSLYIKGFGHHEIDDMSKNRHETLFFNGLYYFSILMSRKPLKIKEL
jgi:hypothetical protein